MDYTALPTDCELDNYIIDGVLDQGGFAITYLAHEKITETRVVIKENFPKAYAHRIESSHAVCPRNKSAERGFEWSQKHFINEAKILAELNHPNIVKVLTAFKGNGTAYYVMSSIEGTNLYKRTPASHEITEEGLMRILQQLLSALRYLHDRELLHRDIKPENILLTAKGTSNQILSNV